MNKWLIADMLAINQDSRKYRYVDVNAVFIILKVIVCSPDASLEGNGFGYTTKI
jgi:hypothetical protein